MPAEIDRERKAGWFDMREQCVQINDLWLNMAVGPASGPPLVLFHGVTRRWQTFQPILPALLARWQVYAVDFPGHGGSQPHPAGDYLVVDYVRAAAAFLRQVVPGPAVVYGHSLGAMVAAAVAAQAPERVRAVVLEDPPFDTMGRRIEQTPLFSFFCGLRGLAGSSEAPEQLADRVAELRYVDPQTGAFTRVGDVRDAAALRFTAESLNRLDPRVLDPIVANRWLENYDRDDVLLRIGCPALLLQADPTVGGMLTDADALAVAALARDCRAVRFPGAGHLLHWDRTADVLKHVTGFLTALEL